MYLTKVPILACILFITFSTFPDNHFLQFNISEFRWNFSVFQLVPTSFDIRSTFLWDSIVLGIVTNAISATNLTLESIAWKGSSVISKNMIRKPTYLWKGEQWKSNNFSSWVSWLLLCGANKFLGVNVVLSQFPRPLYTDFKQGKTHVVKQSRVLFAYQEFWLVTTWKVNMITF